MRTQTTITIRLDYGAFLRAVADLGAICGRFSHEIKWAQVYARCRREPIRWEP